MDQGSTQASRVAKNTVWLGSSKIIDVALAFVYSIYVTRYLGADLAGKLATAMAWVAVFGFATDLGLGTLLTRDIARDQETKNANRYLVNVLALKFVLALLSFAALAIVVLLLRYPADTAQVSMILGVSGVILAGTSGTFVSTFRAYERMEFDAVWAVLKRVSLLLGAVVIVRGGYGLVELAVTHLAISGVELAYYMIVTRQFFFVPSREAFSFQFWPYLVRAGLPYGIAGLVMMIYNKLDTLMLSVLRTEAEIGLYNVALAFRVNLAYVPAVVLSAFFPAIAATFGSRSAMRKVYARAFKAILVLGLPAALGVELLAPQLITGLYGSEFAGAAPALRILMWATVLTCVQQVFVYCMMATNQGRQTAGLITVGAVLNFGLNAALIPGMGIVGAALATLLAELAMVSLAYAILLRQVGYFPIALSVLQCGLSTLVMGAIVLMLQWFQVPWFLIIPAAVVTYGASYLLIDTLTSGGQGALSALKRVFRPGH